MEWIKMNATKFTTDNIPSPSDRSPLVRFEKLQNDLAAIYSQITAEQKSDRFKTILVVDEDEKIQETVKDFMEEYGHTTITTGNGLEALNHFHNVTFDLILTSICVPGVNGNIIARYVKNHTPSLPIIAMSQSVWMAEDYFDTVVEKPLELDSLLQEILFQISKNSNLTTIV